MFFLHAVWFSYRSIAIVAVVFAPKVRFNGCMGSMPQQLMVQVSPFMSHGARTQAMVSISYYTASIYYISPLPFFKKENVTNRLS